MKVALSDASRALVAAAAIAITLLINAQPMNAQTEAVLYSFCSQQNCADGAYPYANVIMDKNGNLYGTTEKGGAYGYGTVFKLSQGKGGAWTETVLYSFCLEQNCADGDGPYGSLAIDGAGNLYGTTYYGGVFGGGTLFKLTPSGVESVLHRFAGCEIDGQNPNAGAIIDKEGNLYGTTNEGGPYCNIYSGGTVFKVTPAGEENLLFSFSGENGANPVAGLIVGKNSDLYGTTYYGGAGNEDGIVFVVTPSGTEMILHSFTGTPGDGANPASNLVMDPEGSLYGTTLNGGTDNFGAIFEIASSGKETLLHSFTNSSKDGANPYAGLIIDSAGNLYGTTFNGGAYGLGTAFETAPTGVERWVYSFKSGGGANPYASLTVGKKGILYGTTVNGGVHGYGTVFKLTHGTDSQQVREISRGD